MAQIIDACIRNVLGLVYIVQILRGESSQISEIIVNAISLVFAFSDGSRYNFDSTEYRKSISIKLFF